jgi:uncharacterized protein (DUF433 family)
VLGGESQNRAAESPREKLVPASCILELGREIEDLKRQVSRQAPTKCRIISLMETATKQVYSHITKDPDVCGGVACIDGTRIRVMDIVSLKRRGESPEQMLEAYPSLDLAQIYASLSYSYEHPEEIEASFEDDRHWEAAHEAEKAKYLGRRSRR